MKKLIWIFILCIAIPGTTQTIPEARLKTLELYADTIPALRTINHDDVGTYKVKGDSLFKQVPYTYLDYRPKGNYPTVWQFVGTIKFTVENIKRFEEHYSEWK